MKPAGAFFLAPLPAAILGAFVSWASGGHPRPVSVAVFYLLLLYAAQLAFGLAIRAFLLKRRKRAAESFALGGAVMVALPAVPYVARGVTLRPDSLGTGIVLLFLWILMGAMTGISHWLLVRPDRTTPGDSRALKRTFE